MNPQRPFRALGAVQGLWVAGPGIHRSPLKDGICPTDKASMQLETLALAEVYDSLVVQATDEMGSEALEETEILHVVLGVEGFHRIL